MLKLRNKCSDIRELSFIHISGALGSRQNLSTKVSYRKEHSTTTSFTSLDKTQMFKMLKEQAVCGRQGDSNTI